jgi:ComF family protein
MKIKFKKFLTDIFFPKFCFGCQKENFYLCDDCESLIEISDYHKAFKTKNLNDLYFATEYKHPLIKKIVQSFRYEPLVKELKKPLANLLTNSFKLLDIAPHFCKKPSEFVLIPIPLEKRRLKWRGFNQAQEIAKELSISLQIPLLNNALIKIKHTVPQVKLLENERKKNMIGVFSCQNIQKTYNKSVLLVDDIYTTGSTMEEAAKILKKSGIKKIIGMTIARSNPKEDFY